MAVAVAGLIVTIELLARDVAVTVVVALFLAGN